jgi:hypothetical protein
MRLSQASVVLLCCLLLAGCADMSTRAGAGGPLAPAPAAGPMDDFAAPPPPPPMGSSSGVISVAPEKITRTRTPEPPAPPRRSTEAPKSEPQAKSSNVGAPVASGADAGDVGLMPAPVRKGAGASSPQSAVPMESGETNPAVTILPVSNPVIERKIDSRFKS